MISTLYPIFRRWSETGSVYILSDMHFEDSDCKLMDPDWISPDEQVEIINTVAHKPDTFICLGDVGNPEYIKKIRAGHKVLITGNHDRAGRYKNVFDEIYTGPLFVAENILLSHEPVYGLSWCLNIHGHDHGTPDMWKEPETHLNLAANVCEYTPVNLGALIKAGILAKIPTLHRMTIDNAAKSKEERKRIGEWEKQTDDIRSIL